MKESAQAAVTWVKSQADRLKIDPAALRQQRRYIHVLAGAILKDGPSAGVAIATSLASLLSQRTVRANVAMTGEISLRGAVMPAGGIKENAAVAARATHTVILPARNRRDPRGHSGERAHETRVRVEGEDRRRTCPGAGRFARPAGGGLDIGIARPPPAIQETRPSPARR